MKKLFIILLFGLLLGCTANDRSRGGKTTENLPKGQKLINVTWKGANLWYLTRPMRSDEVPETYSFKENSNFGKPRRSYSSKEIGVLEGEVVFKESK